MQKHTRDVHSNQGNVIIVRGTTFLQ